MKGRTGSERSAVRRGPSTALALGLAALASVIAWLAGERMTRMAPDAEPDSPGVEMASRRPAREPEQRQVPASSKADELTGILEISDETERTVALLAWLDRLPAWEFPALLENWGRTPLSMSRGREKMLILYAWTQLNPEAAAGWVTKGNEYGLYHVAHIWALRDPLAASDWLDRHLPEGIPREEGQDGVMWGIVESSADLGRSRWAGWGEEDRDRFVEAVGGPVTARGLDFATGWIKAFPDQDSRDRLSKGLAEGFADVDPAKAAAWSASIEGSEARTTAWENIAEVWAGKDPDKAREWAATLPPGEERGGAVAAVVSELGRRDVEAAREWLDSLGGGSELDAARGDIVDFLARVDPQVALEYSAQVTKEEDRSSLKEAVVGDWLKEDESAAIAWISGHPGDLDAEWVKKALARPETPPADAR